MHVVVLGAGYAGLSLVRKLEGSLPPGVDITLVDERETHLVQHLVHRAIRKPAIEDELTIPIADVLARATHKQARVTGVDTDANVVDLEDGSIPYDICANCLGARTAFYGLPGVEEHATPLKRLDHARAIRERFESVRETGGRVIVAGAGLSGVQAAGELAEMARVAEAEPDVVLVEQREQIVPSFPDAFRNAVADELDARGVTVRTGREIQAVDEAVVTFNDGKTLAVDQLVWTGGITAQDAVEERPQVRATLRIGDDRFALGDAARVVDADGQAVPATAQTAVRQADVAATNIARLVGHRLDGAGGFEPRLERYRYTELGWLVSIGDGTVAQVGSRVVRGPAATALKTTVGAGYLTAVGAVEEAADYVHEKVS